MLFSLCLLLAGRASAQWVVTDPTNLAQGIVNTTKQIIQTSSTASNMIKNFQETVKIYEQGKKYYDALKSVNNLVKDARKVQKTILMIGEISDTYVVSFQKMMRDENNVPHDWVESIKVCVADIAANFTTNRMLNDYEERFYRKLHERHERMVAEDFRMAREIAAWKRRVSSAWDKVHVVNTEQFNMDKEAILIGHGYDVEVVVDIDGLRPEDIGVEMILADQITDNKNVRVIAKRELTFVRQDGSRAFYSVRSTPESTGSFDMAIRVFPKNDKLPHRMDFALVKWA